MAISNGNGNSNGSSSFTNPRGGVGFDMSGITPAPVSRIFVIFSLSLTSRSLPSMKTDLSTMKRFSELDLGSLPSRVSRVLSSLDTPVRVPSSLKRSRSMSSRLSSRLSTTPFPSLLVSLERVTTLLALRPRGQRMLVPLLVSSTRQSSSYSCTCSKLTSQIPRMASIRLPDRRTSSSIQVGLRGIWSTSHPFPVPCRD